MTLSRLLCSIRDYEPDHTFELKFKTRFIDLIEKHDNCLDRGLLHGHITGSAWIINSERSHALLTHHRKLNKWLQLGGHADGDSDLQGVALKEATEESGLQSLRFISNSIFDIDIHTIPERGEVPKHEHFDIRYAFVADMNEQPVVNHESKELKWVPIDKIGDLVGNSESIMRMISKTLNWSRPVNKNM